MDTRLYCMCETLYDDERIMVACDKYVRHTMSGRARELKRLIYRCDEWYHPPCVGLKEPDVELVDKFFCPKCHQGESFSIFFFWH